MLGDLVGAGATLFGIDQERKATKAANKANKRQVATARGLLEKGRKAEMGGLDLALGKLTEALGLAGQGDDMALGELVGAESGAYRQLEDQRRQSLASVGNDAQGRGLGGSSIAAMLARGVNRGAADDAGRIASGFGTARAGLAERRGLATQAALGNLASFYSDRASRDASYDVRAADLEAGVEHVVAPGIAAGYGALGALAQNSLNSLGGSLGSLFTKGGKKTPGYTNEEDGGA